MKCLIETKESRKIGEGKAETKQGQQIENSYKCGRYESSYMSYDLKC